MPKILEILTNPSPDLRQVSKAIKLKQINTEEFQELLENLSYTMLKKDGIGLAAPQIGQKVRLFVLSSSDGPIFFINPVINKKSWIKEWGEEGCLSVPKTFGDVRRHKKLVCTYYDRCGKQAKIEADGLMARVIQHEYDHLDGLLFIDKARNIHEQK